MELMLYFDYWACRSATQKLASFAAGMRSVVFPAFDNISERAAEEAERTLAEWSFEPSDDPSRAYEAAHDREIDYGLELQEVADAVLGGAVTALYHLFERQLISFILKQVTPLTSITTWDHIEGVLRHFGIDVTAIPSAPDLHELRLVSNVLKHGEGRSFERLRKLNSRVLQEPPVGAKVIGEFLVPGPHSILGTALYLTLDDFDRYVAATLAFWDHTYWKRIGERCAPTI
jgi:hypothetical protein